MRYHQWSPHLQPSHIPHPSVTQRCRHTIIQEGEGLEAHLDSLIAKFSDALHGSTPPESNGIFHIHAGLFRIHTLTLRPAYTACTSQ